MNGARLCLDAGNTRLKFGLHDGHGWCVQGALTHAEVLAGALIALPLPCAPTQIVACNVAGQAMHEAIEHLAGHWQLRPHWLRSTAQAHGVRNGYARPEQLGADRWAALIGARSLHAGACVVVMAGTATTVDALTAEGHFRGGLILPGLTLMRQALAGGTAGLPVATEASGDYQCWPESTDAAIVSGSLFATSGAIERLRRQLGTPETPGTVPCILSGGAGEALRTLIEAPVIWQPALVLEGLLRCAGDLPDTP